MKATLRAAAALAGTVSLFAMTAPAFAQDAAAPADADAASLDEAPPGEIVVTAQKRTERLQDVPVAVSVLSADALATSAKPSLESAVALVPSLNFVKAGTALNQTLFLRGLGTTTLSIAVDPSVSTVLDGVVLSRSAEAFTDLVDIERIEVLRGPQGTLFGRNASAGVINIVSKRPGRDFGGELEGAYFFENGTEYRVKGALDLPVSESIRTRTTAFYDKYDGNIRNIAPNVNDRVNGLKHYGVRSVVEADLSDTVRLTLIGDYHKNNDNCCADIIAGPPRFSATALVTPGAVNPTALALIQTVLPTLRGDKTRAVNQNRVTRTIEKGYGFSGQFDVELGNQTITSITAYRNFANREIRDGDFYPQSYIGAQQSHDDGPQTGNTFSQELRLTSPGKQFFDYVLGAYFSNTFTKRIFERNNTFCAAATGAVIPVGVFTPCTSPLAAPSVAAFGRSTFTARAKNFALFGQGTLNISDDFRLIGGLRYTTDQLDATFVRVTSAVRISNAPFDAGVFAAYNNFIAAGMSPTAAETAAAPFTNGIPLHTKTTANNFSGKGGAQYDFSRDVTGYATYTRGYKGPAYNLFFNLQPTLLAPLKPETSDAYEVGLKNSLLGGTLTVNVAGYYARYYNFQANNPDSVTFNGQTTVIGRFTNAGTVSTRGAELDFAYRPTRNFSITGGAAYTDAKIDKFRAPAVRKPNDIVPNGTRLPFAPKFKGSVAVDYRIRTGGAVDFALGAQGNYQSSQDSVLTPDPVIRKAAFIGSYGIVNASVSVIDGEDRWKLTFVARNLFDTSYAATIIGGGPSGAYRYQIPRDADRYFGVIGKINF